MLCGLERHIGIGVDLKWELKGKLYRIISTVVEVPLYSLVKVNVSSSCLDPYIYNVVAHNGDR